jgi:hypothetical protein
MADPVSLEKVAWEADQEAGFPGSPGRRGGGMQRGCEGQESVSRGSNEIHITVASRKTTAPTYNSNIITKPLATLVLSSKAGGLYTLYVGQMAVGQGPHSLLDASLAAQASDI